MVIGESVMNWLWSIVNHIVAVWSLVLRSVWTVTCIPLPGEVNHSVCCQQAGVPAQCLTLCSGRITHRDHSRFDCLSWIPVMNSCFGGLGKVSVVVQGF